LDTDDLSINTYNAVIVEAERFHHDLTLQFGLLASGANSDDEYLDRAEAMISHWKTNWEMSELMVEVFYVNQRGIGGRRMLVRRGWRLPGKKNRCTL
jgi:hypothetical protein